jgi:hypothetical protein
MARLTNVNDVMNRVAVEVGLSAATDPVSSTDESFVQLKGLLNSAGQELVHLHQWQLLNRDFSFTTADGDTGIYQLPDDFSAMIDQTGWDKSNNVAMGGPLSDQDWAYLAGRDLVSQSIYASFKLQNNELWLYPQPPSPDIDISFSYQSNSWLAEAGNFEQRHTTVQTGSDVVLYLPILIVKFLKVKMLEAKGFDAQAARLEFENMMDAITGQDVGASILSAGRNSRGFPYISPYYSTPDTGYGM